MRTKLTVAASLLGIAALLGSAVAASATTPNEMPQGAPAATVVFHGVTQHDMPSP